MGAWRRSVSRRAASSSTASSTRWARGGRVGTPRRFVADHQAGVGDPEPRRADRGLRGARRRAVDAQRATPPRAGLVAAGGVRLLGRARPDRGPEPGRTPGGLRHRGRWPALAPLAGQHRRLVGLVTVGRIVRGGSRGRRDPGRSVGGRGGLAPGGAAGHRAGPAQRGLGIDHVDRERRDALARAPAVNHNADGRLEVFSVAADHQLWHSFQTAPDSGWSPGYGLGGVLAV